ncbi:HAMP domain-containing histidine kinase [Clostridium sp. NSJ-145]|uniref:HAMP domain-containing sensor histidine kinase n=1 Tax=Clostridium sp. NSJ-145 TaxID=2897777 RepID=UPI001E2A4478|nr:HAMP domain-containing sensor histidine kinase [Clostridium sp. NSJ-145]MCD2501315.1 HAMP domain-containing histidine kinase [Clostridium sp. NSJ-145]
MDTKLKNIKSKYSDYIIYGLILILSSSIFLSVMEIRNNYRFFSEKSLYLGGELNSEIESYAAKAVDYSLFYKSSDYAKDKENITENDIEICKDEIRVKIESETSEKINSLYNDSSFKYMSDERIEKKIEEVSKEVEDKYNFTDDEFEQYVLERKIKSYNTLSNELNSYKNLNFSAYDETTKKWISNEKKDIANLKTNSGYFAEINIATNGKLSKNIYVDGKSIEEEDYYNYYDYYYPYTYYESVVSSETKYEGYDADSIENHNIVAYVWVPKQIAKGDSVYSAWQIANENRNRLLLSGVVLLVSVLILLCIARVLKKKNYINNIIDIIINKIKDYPIEYKLAVGLGIWIIYMMSRSSIYYKGYISWFNFKNIILTAILFGVWYILLRDLYLNYKEKTILKNNISVKLWAQIQVLMKNGSIFRSILLMFLIYATIGGILLFMAMVAYDLFPVFLIAGIVVTIIFIIIVLKKLAYLEKIMDGAKDGAEGRLTYKIEEKGQGRFRDLAHNINNMKEGLRESLQNEVKSERMKTELITNVSHDLKTPLTSIINYIDLLKREDIEPESARDYVNVLDNKAQRLKVLIDDLFEASKAASGAMELNIEKIEIVQLLKQVLGENDERISNHGLSLRVNTPEEKVFIKGDGKRLYRVFENLISNIVKYSMENTRVYIDIIKEDECVKIVMKNIAAYELNFDVNEITERFKRADEARTSEGSGLGLAIAKSIVELHGGTFYIEVDGDLFKSIITLKCS